MFYLFIDISNENFNAEESTRKKQCLSPFKKAFIWPEIGFNKTSKKYKENIPSVATCSEWIQYHEKKELKNQKKIVIEERKKLRKELQLKTARKGRKRKLRELKKKNLI